MWLATANYNKILRVTQVFITFVRSIGGIVYFSGKPQKAFRSISFFYNPAGSISKNLTGASPYVEASVSVL